MNDMTNTSTSNTKPPAFELVANREGWKEVEVNGKVVEIPADWDVMMIESAFQVLGGGTPPTSDPLFWGGSIVWTGPKYMGNDQRYVDVSHPDNRKLTSEGAKKVSDQATPAGSLIVSSRAPVGYANLAPCELYTNQGCYSLIKNGNAEAEYAYFWIRKNKSVLDANASGTTFMEISRKKLSMIEIPLPPLPEQTRIASVLSTQEDHIQDLRQLAKVERQRLEWLSDELLTGRLRVIDKVGGSKTVVQKDADGKAVEELDAFELVANGEGWKEVEVNGKVVEIPEGWEVKKISEAVSLVSDRTIDGYNYVGLENIESETGRLISYGNKLVKDASSGKYYKGNILFSKLRPYLKKCWISNVDGTCSTEILVMETKNAAKIIVFHLLGHEATEKFNGSGHGTHIPRTDWKTVSSFEIPLPPLPEQTRIATVLSTQERQVSDIEALIAKEEQRLAWLSDELLSGRLRVVERQKN